jgi:hypothetical protein
MKNPQIRRRPLAHRVVDTRIVLVYNPAVAKVCGVRTTCKQLFRTFVCARRACTRNDVRKAVRFGG